MSENQIKFRSGRAHVAINRFSKASKRWLWILLLGLYMITACTAAFTLYETDEVVIYSAVIHRIYTQDDTFGGTFNAPIVYLLPTTDDSVGDPDIHRSESQPLPKSVQGQIESSLADLPARVVWVDDPLAVPVDTTTGAVANSGAILTLGNIHIQRSGTALVSGSIYIASLASGGQTYILEKIDGVWEISGTTGVSRIS
jgi:hypothetical protein